VLRLEARGELEKKVVKRYTSLKNGGRMEGTKRISLVAHDNLKRDLVEINNSVQ
jgi:hypothetical protein